MPPALKLPRENGLIVPYMLLARPLAPPKPRPFVSRVAYAAAHVVAAPGQAGSIDWDSTMAFRRHLWSLGFKVAEAMDTAQRGMGLDWSAARELIARSLAEAQGIPGADLASGAGTDHLDPQRARSIDDVIAAYEEQLGFIEARGGRAIMMASRALARVAKSPDDYVKVYDHILSQARDKVILHWLGDMFDPQLAGYWGSSDVATAMDVVLGIIGTNHGKVEGIKISLLEARYEIELRRRLPEGVLMYTGDDFNYPDLIAGDERGHSHALLGIFDPIAPAAALALQHLDQGDKKAFHDVLDPTVPLSRRIFEAPTWNYKSGVVFLAWLNGFQQDFIMVGGQQTGRSIAHYAEVFRLADQCGLLRDPDLAQARMRQLLREHAIEQ
ncbi:MAG: dihydrodipicolinate synthase family protein [Rhizobiales bacterium]|nr:dihydrodipicolinate synthase family protein [Hyphomicrobiales bacterium]MBI3674713.1 dihydrodipicolinate synthase family protein [Hyphomicrobiales bacterium]